MVIAFVCLLATTALPIIIFGYYRNKTIISDLGNDLIEQASTTVIEKTVNYFLPVSIAVEMSSRLAELGAISLGDFKQMEMYTLGVLNSYPQTSIFYFGDEQGNYVHARRLADGNTESWIISASASPPTSSLIFRDAALKVARVEMLDDSDYDPRVRPWYVGAKRTRANFWTDVYISFSSHKPAITCSQPVFDPDGKLTGVWATDIELDEISSFLKRQRIGKSGIELIINAKSEIVAYPELSSIIRKENGVLRPVKVEELGIEPLSVAYREYVRTGKNRSAVEFGGKTYFTLFREFPEPFPKRWKIAVIVPEEDFTGGAKREMIIMLLISSVMLGLAVLLAFAISRRITSPVQLITEATGKIKNFNLDEKIHIPSRMKEIQLMRDSISSMQKGLRAFRRYVPAELVRQLVSVGEGAQLGGQKKELTVFFSDISGFTSIAERMTPEQLMLHLSEYFDELTKIVTCHRGTVDKYIGDAIMAFWGAPVPDDDHAVHACEAGLACQEKIAELNRKWIMEDKSALVTRIGISTGPTVVGNVGSHERMNYTVMGDNVNMASRLEGANKTYGTQIIVSGKTYEAASSKFLFRPLGVVALRGKVKGMAIYELVGRRS
jgi:adenylate cyclase